MVFHPRRFPGLLIGGGVVVAVLLLAALVFLRLRTLPPSLLSLGGVLLFLLLLGLALTYGLWTFGLLSLRYTLDDSRLSIHWLGMWHDIPLNQIEEVIRWRTRRRTVPLRGIRWWGYQVGELLHPELGWVPCYAAVQSPRELLFIRTPERAYALSPARVEPFIESLGARLTQGPVQPAVHTTYHGVLTGLLARWQDPVLSALLGACALFSLVFFGYVAYRYPSLPQVVPLHFTPTGEPDRMGLKDSLFVYPWIAFAFGLGNSVLALLLHPWERWLSYLCLTAAIVVQFILMMALLQLL